MFSGKEWTFRLTNTKSEMEEKLRAFTRPTGKEKPSYLLLTIYLACAAAKKQSACPQSFACLSWVLPSRCQARYNLTMHASWGKCQVWPLTDAVWRIQACWAQRYHLGTRLSRHTMGKVKTPIGMLKLLASRQMAMAGCHYSHLGIEASR